MHRIAEHHAARASLIVLALVVALGVAMCVRIHGALPDPDARSGPRAWETSVAVLPPADPPAEPIVSPADAAAGVSSRRPARPVRRPCRHGPVRHGPPVGRRG